MSSLFWLSTCSRNNVVRLRLSSSRASSYKYPSFFRQIYDDDGPVVADAFYEELFRSPDGEPEARPDITRSALALHLAVSKLRSSGVEFHRWVPFIHMGK